MPEYRLLYVPLALLDPLWPRLAPLIEQARAYSCGEYELEDVRALVAAQKGQLWGVVGEEGIAGAIVTKIIEYPRVRALHVLYLAGRDFDTWEQPHAALEGYAREQGCSEIHLTGRAGWARKLSARGYSEQYRTLRKALK